jgi:hypothetical protein
MQIGHLKLLPYFLMGVGGFKKKSIKFENYSELPFSG